MSIADKLTTIAENVPKVYNAGVEDGKQAEYDAFWDKFQQNGTRTTYAGGVGGMGWTKDTFKPKYPVSLKGTAVADYMFIYFNRISSTDVDDLFDFTEFNSMFDFSGCKRLTYTFYNARIKNLYVDCSSATEMTLTFCADNGGYIENLTLKVTATTASFNSTFDYQRNMKNITFTEDSVISAKIAFSQSSKLTKASITSIINALSSTKSGLSVTLSKTAVNKAFETSTGANDGSTSAEWLALIATRSNWTISLV